MSDIKFKTVVPGGINRQDGKYHCRLIHNRIVKSEDVAADMAAVMHMDKIDAQLYLSTVCAYITKSIRAGNMVNFGPFSLILSLRGTVEGANGPYGDDQEGVSLNIKAGDEIRDALESLKPVNVSVEKGGNPRISSVIDGDYKTDGVISARSKVLVAGTSLLTDPARDDEGISLETHGGRTIATGTVLASTSTTLDAIFEGDVPAGQCYIVIRTRSGDPTRPNPSITRHRVTVIRS